MASDPPNEPFHLGPDPSASRADGHASQTSQNAGQPGGHSGGQTGGHAGGQAADQTAGADRSNIEVELDRDARVLGMLCHLLAACGFVVPFGGVIGPLVMWLVKKDEVAFVDFHGKESLNFQITVLIPVLPLVAMLFVPFVNCLAWVALVGLAVTNLVFIILACLSTHEGNFYRYPVSLRIIE